MISSTKERLYAYRDHPYANKEDIALTAAKSKRLSRDFTTGPILPQILLFSLPLMATSILQKLFNTADTIMVGRFSGTPEECETALAAVGSCGSLIDLLVGLFLGLAVGAGVCVAHDIGAKHYKDVSRVAHTSVIAACVCGVLVSIFGFFMARPLLAMMGTGNGDQGVLDQAVLYMRAYFFGIPASLIYNYCAAMLRSSGDTVRPMIFLSVSGVVNVVFNFILVVGFGLGALGVGIATAISNWIACFLILAYMFRFDGPCKLELKKLRVDPKKLRKIILLGIPAGIQGSLFAVSNVMIQSSVNSFGKVVVAGKTSAANLEAYIYITQNALYQTALTLVGQNVGARKFDRLKRCILWCTLVVTVIGITLGCAVYFFGHALIGIFAPGNEAVIAAGIKKLSITGITQFLCGLMEVGCGIMRGLGKSLTPMFVSLIGSCLLRLVWIWTVFACFPSPETLYISYPITWIITAATHYICCFITVRKRLRLEAVQG